MFDFSDFCGAAGDFCDNWGVDLEKNNWMEGFSGANRTIFRIKTYFCALCHKLDLSSSVCKLNI